MRGTKRRACMAAAALTAAVAGGAEELARKDAQGRWVPIPPAVDESLRNPWSPAEESAFLDRVQVCIAHNTGKGNYGNTFFENEKSSYPPAMYDVLFANRAKGVAWLQSEDNQAGSWNSLTEGIDFYACFTIKHQMRKYFLLGPALDPAYRERMKRGARKWTEQDPVTRPNPFFKAPGDGWTPETKNAWVDGRNTDNLRAMRETSVYLMAEETGNEEVRRQYQRAIQRYVWALWNIGMGEWDSENYHMHTFGPYLNLYDFAKDPAMRRTAKAALDMLATMGAAKYLQGGFCGPIKRDYEKPYVFGGAAGELWLYFGDTPTNNPAPHGDTVHLVTSAYRPPAAVLALARKRFAAPVEWFACKPEYETWKVEGAAGKGRDYPAANYADAAHKPAYFETTCVGQTFQLGTLPQGSHGDVNGFKLLLRDSRRGAQFFSAAAVDDPGKVNRGSGRERIAQNRNLALVLVPDGATKWAFLVPSSIEVDRAGAATVLKTEATWLAIHPVNLRLAAPDGQTYRKWPNLQGMTAEATGGAVSGFALEVGEAATHGDYAAFKAAVAKSRLEAPAAGAGRVTFVAADGRSVGLEALDAPLPKVYRDGKERDFGPDSWAMWRAADGGASPLSLGWKKGVLRVEAGGKTFDAEFTRDGRYTFRHSGQ
jgi:hypothetical protein